VCGEFREDGGARCMVCLMALLICVDVEDSEVCVGSDSEDVGLDAAFIDGGESVGV